MVVLFDVDSLQGHEKSLSNVKTDQDQILNDIAIISMCSLGLNLYHLDHN